MKNSFIYSLIITVGLSSTLYGFNILAMHYILGFIPAISIIISCVICLIKNIKGKVKNYIMIVVLGFSIISIPVSHIISISNPFNYKYENIDGGIEIVGYRCNILNNYGNFSIEIPYKINNKKVKSIGEYAFYASEHFNDLIIPEGVDTIKGWAFAHANYKSLSFPNTLKRIEYSAFSQHEISVDYVIIPNSLEYIGTHAFFMSVSVVVLEDGVNYKNFDETCFLGPTSIYYESVGTEISDGVLYVLNSKGTAIVAKINKGLSNVNIKESLIFNNKSYTVIGLGDYAGAYCNFENINIPNTINIIGREAFRGNTKIKEIYIPNSVIEIGYDSFLGCSNLIINVGFEEKPLGWNDGWNPSNCLVNWNVKP